MIITLFRRNYPAHRLAWLYVHGKWPNGHLDHINRNPSHNVIANLREATAAENAYNRKTRRDNRVGLKGVSRTKYGTFKAWIQVNKKPLYLGSYPTPEKAHAAYVAAAQKHFGEFARST
jgi:hypothetical protein